MLLLLRDPTLPLPRINGEPSDTIPSLLDRPCSLSLDATCGSFPPPCTGNRGFPSALPLLPLALLLLLLPEEAMLFK